MSAISRRIYAWRVPRGAADLDRTAQRLAAARIFVGDAETATWFGGRPGAYVVYPDRRSGDEVSFMRVTPATMTRRPMRLDLGSPVRCTDDAFGELADVVIDPTTRRVTHLVVQPQQRHEEARLVPVDRAHAGETSDAAISLGCTVAEMSGFELLRESAYLRLGEVPVEDPDWDVGIEEPLVLPSYTGLNSVGAEAVDVDPHVMLSYDRIPMGEVEIRRASTVTSTDGHHLGHVDGFVLDGEQQIAHLVLEHGHLWGRREVIIPIGAVARVETDAVVLTLSKDEVGALESVRVHRRRS